MSPPQLWLPTILLPVFTPRPPFSSLLKSWVYMLRWESWPDATQHWINRTCIYHWNNYVCSKSASNLLFIFSVLFCRDLTPYRLEEDRMHAMTLAAFRCLTDKLIVDWQVHIRSTAAGPLSDSTWLQFTLSSLRQLVIVKRGPSWSVGWKLNSMYIVLGVESGTPVATLLDGNPGLVSKWWIDVVRPH